MGHCSCVWLCHGRRRTGSDTDTGKKKTGRGVTMPKMISDEKRRAIQDAIKAGMRLMDIREQLSTSAMTISAIKREMGLPMRKRRAAPETVPQGDSTDTTMYDLFGDGWEPAPPPYTPQEYFEAIADGLRQRDMENNTLKLERDRLRVENLKLLSDLNQCKLQMAQQWSGPAILPNRVSLGNGG